MLDPTIFPGLESRILQDYAKKLVRQYSFISKVLLCHDAKNTGRYVLVCVIPNRAELIDAKDIDYATFEGFDAVFDRRADFEDRLRDAGARKGFSATIIEAESEEADTVTARIVTGYFWTLHAVDTEEVPAGDGRTKSKATSTSEFDKGLLDLETKALKKNPRLSIPAIARLALTQKDDWLYSLKPGSRREPKQETIEKRLRRLRRQKP
jgi:hypothetical protein